MTDKVSTVLWSTFQGKTGCRGAFDSRVTYGGEVVPCLEVVMKDKGEAGTNLLWTASNPARVLISVLEM